MPKDETTETSKSSGIRRWFEVPGPVRQLFDRFPLVTYPANQLPGRSPDRRNEHALYIFTTRAGARYGEPSFNPSCLKWQVCGAIGQLALPTLAHNQLGISQIRIRQIPYGPFEQSLSPHRSSAFSLTCRFRDRVITRDWQHHTFQQASEMG